MGKYIEVINEKPDSRKKGLRMIVKGIEIDDYGQIDGICCEYSVYKKIGVFSAKLKAVNPIYMDLAEVDDGK